MAPTFNSALTGAVKSPVSSMPSRLTVLNPDNVNVTEYVPGTRLMILYWPSPSVTTVRLFSISAGLAASTVTPGMTPPLASRTTPAIACANAADWPIAKHASASTPSLAILLIGFLPSRLEPHELRLFCNVKPYRIATALTC
jgi:hypothetical protein